MKRKALLFGSLLVASLAMFVAYATAQDAQPAAAPMAADPDADACPACMLAMTDPPPAGQEMADAATKPAMTPEAKEMMQKRMEKCKAMMKEAGITEQMMQRQCAKARAEMFVGDPAPLLAQAKMLALTDEQKTKLMDIQKEARDKAMMVLTADQKTKLGEMPDKPMSVRDGMMMLHKMMMPMCEKMMKEGKDGKMMCCPMMHGMMHKGMEAKPPAKSDSEAK